MTNKIEEAIRSLLKALGEDVTRPGLVDTPSRVANAWEEWVSGYRQDPSSHLKTFQEGTKGEDLGLVTVTGVPVWSMCEHHLAPFFGVAHVAYVPRGSVVGLSKFSRVVNAFSRRLQVQERLTRQVADCIMNTLQPAGVAVMLECRHMCMESRGVHSHGSRTKTTILRGVFVDDAKARSEFYSQIPVWGD